METRTKEEIKKYGRYEVVDSETGNWKLESFKRYDSAINYAIKEEEDGILLSVFDHKTGEYIR